MFTRRDAIKSSVLTAAALAVPSVLNLQSEAATAEATGPFKLPSLGYAFDALEPFIDAQTMEIHHDKHHAAYVKKLNELIAAAPEPLHQLTFDELIRCRNKIPEEIRAPIRNQAGGHYNHSLFWQMLKKNDGGAPKADLAKAIDKFFGSYDGFKKQFSDAALSVFGIGWAWLVIDPQKHELVVVSTANQGNPISNGQIPLLGIDVWEHAYYLKYQNKRADYVAAFTNVINWDFVGDRFTKMKA